MTDPEATLDELTLEMIVVMKTIPLLRGFDDELLLKLASESDLRRVRSRDVVCREGDYGTVFWVILSGLIKVVKRAEDGKSVPLATLGTGAFFGEMGPMSAQPRAATCVAEVDSFLLEVPEESLFSFMKQVPAFKSVIDAAYKSRALLGHLTLAPLFKGLSRPTLQNVVEVSVLATVPKDSVVVAEGQTSDAFYLVRHGYLRVTKKKGEREEIVAYLRDNTYFGDQALLGGGEEVATVTTMSDCELVVLTREVFEIVAKAAPELEARRAALGALHVEKLKAMTAVPESNKMEVMIRKGLVQTRDALVIHTDKCTKCEMCVESCSAVHGGHPLIQLTGMRVGDLLLPASCYNCKTPECMLACRFGCITRDRTGQIFINEDTCTGCTQCSRKCPYGTIFMVDRDEEDLHERGMFSRIFGAWKKSRERPAAVIGDDYGKPVAGQADESTAGALATRKVKKDQAALAAAAEKSSGAVNKGTNAPDQPKGPKKAKRLAVKCDQCMGHGFTACVYNCPTGAIERVSAERLFEML